MPGNSRSLWSAVKIAKDTGTNDIPQNMSYNGVVVAGNEVAEAFAEFLVGKLVILLTVLKLIKMSTTGTTKS